MFLIRRGLSFYLQRMDVIAALEAIMHQNTAYYQSDFAYDIKMLRETARSILMS